jgi:hypothetical protein
MRVLVACEESQVVATAFRKQGHEAYSCDIIPCSGGHPEWHIQGDIRWLLTRSPTAPIFLSNGKKITGEFKFDMMIAHPPCTYLCNSGVRWLYNSDKTINTERYAKMKEAARFFQHLWSCDIPRICIENPVMHGLGKYEAGVAQCYDLPEFKQIIHPWMFGHMEQKATCLWKKNLPDLIPTNNVKEAMMKLPNRERQRLHWLPPSKDRAKLRSKTYTGIGEAMAIQWGVLV